MYPTRDSMVWLFTLGAALIAYLLAADKPPTEWNYREWLQAGAAAFATLSAKLQGSPLQLSYKGQEQVAQGKNPFYEVPSNTSPGDTVVRPSMPVDSKLTETDNG